MNYISFRDNMKEFTIFSLADVRRLDAKFHRRRLNEWQKKGYLVKVAKGRYIFSDLKIGEETLYEIANRIYSPSYVSFQTALSHYGLIPESVYVVMSASSRKTYRFKTAVGAFIYRAIRPRLFFGYDIVEKDRTTFKLATPEKALLDLFYLDDSLKTEADFESLRVNKDVFRLVVNRRTLSRYLKKFNHKKLKERVSAFLRFQDNA